MIGDWRTFALGSAVFAALTAIFGKIGVSQLNSNLATFFRTLVILVVVAAIVWSRDEWQRPDHVSLKGMAFLVLSGVATGFSWLCYYRALQMAPASRVAPIDKLSAVFVVLFAVFFLREPITPRLVCGALLITGGVLLLAL